MNSADDYSVHGPSTQHEVSGLPPLASTDNRSDQKAARGKRRKRRKDRDGRRTDEPEETQDEREEGDDAAAKPDNPHSVDYLA
jgi:hypothetical protein